MHPASEIHKRRFAENLEYLRRSHPSVYEKVMGSDELFLEQSESGHLTAKRAGRYLASPHDPEKEAARFESAAAGAPGDGAPAEGETVFFLGIGLGYHVNLLRKGRASPGVVIEPDTVVFKAALHVLETDVLGGLLLFIGLSEAELRANTRFLRYDRYRIVTFGRSMALERNYFGTAASIIRGLYRERHASVRTERSAKRLWVRNILHNISSSRRYFGTKKLESSLSGPAVLAASGPGLESAVPEIARLSGRAVVMSLLPSVPFLAGRGLEPDFAVTTDGSFWNRYRESRTGIPLISTYSADYGLLRNWEGDVFLFSHGLPLERALPVISESSLTLPMQGTAAIVMILLARSLGLSPLFLAGFDFAYNGVLSHVRGGGFDDLFLVQTGRLKNWQTVVLERLRADVPVFVDDCRGGRTVSSHKLVLYRDWLQREVNLAGVMRLNNGAFVEGLELADPKRALRAVSGMEPPARPLRLTREPLFKEAMARNLMEDGACFGPKDRGRAQELFYGPMEAGSADTDYAMDQLDRCLKRMGLV